MAEDTDLEVPVEVKLDKLVNMVDMVARKHAVVKELKDVMVRISLVVMAIVVVTKELVVLMMVPEEEPVTTAVPVDTQMLVLEVVDQVTVAMDVLP